MIRAFASSLLALGLVLGTGLPLLRARGGDVQEPAPGAAQALTEKEELVQALFECEDEPALEAAIAAAEKAEIPRQAILEARFLFLVDQQDFKAVSALAPVLEKQKAAFRIDDSVIFSVPEEFYAIIEYCHALGALEQGDLTRFKRHITEAFWLSPRQAAAFAPHIERLRREQAMARIKIDFNQQFARQDDGAKVSLKSLAGESAHLVVHFWSPWSNESEAYLPDFIAIVEELAGHRIPVTSILIEPGSDAVKAAREFREGIPAKDLGNWIVDNSGASLARKLRVLELPTIAVLQVDGTILFSGHPSEEELWSALQKLDDKIERPRLEPAE